MVQYVYQFLALGFIRSEACRFQSEMTCGAHEGELQHEKGFGRLGGDCDACAVRCARCGTHRGCSIGRVGGSCRLGTDWSRRWRSGGLHGGPLDRQLVGIAAVPSRTFRQTAREGKRKSIGSRSAVRWLPDRVCRAVRATAGSRMEPPKPHRHAGGAITCSHPARASTAPIGARSQSDADH
jgi:hypothetical protein